MATTRERKTLSAPAVFVDGRRLAIVSGTGVIEYMGEVSTRTVNAGGGKTVVVHGYDASTDFVKAKFQLAHTRENAEWLRDYKARAKSIQMSTIKFVEDEDQEIVTNAVLTNSQERSYEPEGGFDVEFSGDNTSF